MTRRILHLAGSAVSDFFCDLSRLYAQDCLAATAAGGPYESHIAYVTPDRLWRFPADLGPAALSAAAPMPVANALRRIAELRIDVMVPQMFCLPGMTSYRAMFDVLGIPYAGNTAGVMALAANKARTRAVVAAAGVRVPEGQLLRRGDHPEIPPPAVVKPVDADNSVGVSLVRRPEDFPAALETAFAHAGEVLAERYIELGREVRCGIIDRCGELICLPLEEYRVNGSSKPIRDSEDKLRRGQEGGLQLVAKDSSRAWMVDPADPVTQPVWDAAKKCHTALGCRHYSLFDFRIDPAGQPWFLEAGLYCSFARQSVITMMAAAAGIPLSDLFPMVLDQALGGGLLAT
jgi:D-alanine-D-alanine ligase